MKIGRQNNINHTIEEIIRQAEDNLSYLEERLQHLVEQYNSCSVVMGNSARGRGKLLDAPIVRFWCQVVRLNGAHPDCWPEALQVGFITEYLSGFINTDHKDLYPQDMDTLEEEIRWHRGLRLEIESLIEHYESIREMLVMEAEKYLQ